MSFASIVANVCAALTIGGGAVNSEAPTPQPIDVNQIVRVGPYIGARHTPALRQAASTIYLRYDGRKPDEPMFLHVKEGQLTIQNNIAAALRGVKKAAEQVCAEKLEEQRQNPAPKHLERRARPRTMGYAPTLGKTSA